ncbi:MAG: threonylcarbamoyl-AMP synthase [Spirochaetaceae bacterium]|jgi:L-threonylcarbamoyladenylate synthase|nr:threonylcarbamoyl-AMP synthase [Spirochaetaceae bacterium]
MELLSGSDADILRAAAALKEGALVVFPTETVYGLGADAFNPDALAKVFAVKERPLFDPLIIHIAGLDALDRIVEFSLLGQEGRKRLTLLAASLWPGPLTLVLPKKKEVPGLATGGLATAALRFPDHDLAQKLIRASTNAVAAPSANLFGRLSPTRVEHVLDQLGDRVDYIIDGGRLRVGLESTVLDLTSPCPRILRPGGTSREDIEKTIGPVEGPESQAKRPAPAGASREGGEGGFPLAHQGLLSPGQLTSHYAPRTTLLLYSPAEMENLAYNGRAAYLFFDALSRDRWLSARYASGGAPANVRALCETGDTRRAAANLFALLHELDSGGYECIHAETAPPLGLGPAINDRLSRAAAET